MKIIHSSIIRSLPAIATGVLLIMYSDKLLYWLVITIGVLFFISGVISLCSYSYHKHKQNLSETSNEQIVQKAPLSFPIVGIGSILLGVILVCMPSTFIHYLIYLFAAMLILGAISQFVNLVRMIKIRPLHWVFWILPTIVLIVGCISVLDPGCIANLISTIPAIIIGSFLILYGITEIINSIQISRLRRKVSHNLTPINKEDIEDAKIIEETPPTTNEP